MKLWGRMVLLLALPLVGALAPAQAGELAYVAGVYQGQVVLGQMKDGKPQPGMATPIRAELRQKAQRLGGLLYVGQDPDDQIVLEINQGMVEGDKLWFKGDELLWKVSFQGRFKDGRITGQAVFASQDPTKKLYGQSKVKDYTPTKMGGPLDMKRR